MARDRKRSKQRQQRRARAHRTDTRATAQRAFGRPPEEDTAALNGDELEPVAEPGELAPSEVDAAKLQTEHHADTSRAAEQEIDEAAADPDLLAADPEVIADPTADPRFAAATEPDFDAPVRRPFEESDYDREEEDLSDDGVAAATARLLPSRQPVKGNRVTGFLRASWAELQRVQWPNRQQVFQATAVVLGFVAIAGAFLALADFVAGKVVDAIL